MDVAERTGADILSVDSMQVYRGMDIGTAKPTREERRRIAHHMVDVADPAENFTVARFRREARTALGATRAPVVLIVGGSGLHFRSIVDPMRFRPTDSRVREELNGADPRDLVSELRAVDPGAGEVMDLSNPRRVIRALEAWRIAGIKPTEWAATPESEDYRRYEAELEFCGIGVDRPDIGSTVSRRLDDMRRRGFLSEVERLAPRLGPTAVRALGYRELLEVIEGRASPDEAFSAIERNTHRLVKRQRTFFRRDPRLRWFDARQPDVADMMIKEAGL